MNTDPPWRLVPRIAARFAWLARTQWWDRAAVARYADARLRDLVRHAGRHVPYYRELFRRIGLDPATFRGHADLSRIPPLDKETFRARRDEFVADNAAAFHPEWSKTSGSTGTPLRFLIGRESRVHDGAAFLRAYGEAGYWPYLTTAFWARNNYQTWDVRRRLAGRCLGFNPRHLCEENITSLWREINRLRPAVFNGYPYTLYLLARLARDAGLAIHVPRTLICVGETLTDSLRAGLVELYPGARLFDVYGLSENVALIASCPRGTLHAMDDYAFHEFVDAAGAPVTEGVGEILGTAYFSHAMPLIRYRTLDFARVRPPDWICPCGRHGHRAVAAIEGRREDHLQTPDGRLVTFITPPVGYGRGIAASQYVQDRPDHLMVNIIPGPDYDPAGLPEVERQLRLRLGPEIAIEFRTVTALERRPGDRGKIPFVLSRLTRTIYATPNIELSGSDQAGNPAGPA